VERATNDDVEEEVKKLGKKKKKRKKREKEKKKKKHYLIIPFIFYLIVTLSFFFPFSFPSLSHRCSSCSSCMSDDENTILGDMKEWRWEREKGTEIYGQREDDVTLIWGDGLVGGRHGG
jgi:amino acid transporter